MNKNWIDPNDFETKRVTLHTVAEHAGVSKSTVSLVLQNDSRVNEKTRSKVLQSIDETGYVYNRKAASLRQGQSHDQFGVVLHGFHSPYSGEILNHVEQLALQQDLFPLMVSNSESVDRQEKVVRLCMEQNVGGFIICPAPETTASWLNDLWRNGFPCVQIMREVAFSQLPSLLADNRNGIRSVTNHLIKLGHKKIAFVGGDERASDYHERLAGYMDAMNDASLPVSREYIRPTPQTRAAGRTTLVELKQYDAGITATVCFSDLIAYGVLSMARELGLNVGTDFAVTGFDDLADSWLTHPALTTVQVRPQDIANNAIEMLQHYMKNKTAEPERRIIPAKLIIRESCGAQNNNNSRGND